MNIKNYRKRKEGGHIELKALGGGDLVLIASNFDPLDGSRLKSEKADVTLTGIEAELEKLNKNIDEMNDFKADLEALIADIKDANENFENGAEILGKKSAAKPK